ncbi:unnamed protein product, partial [Polarella glacialis]
AAQLLAAGWRHAGRGSDHFVSARDLGAGAHFRPPAELVASCEEAAHGAGLYLALAAATIFVACHALCIFRRPLALIGEELLSRVCIVKIGGCVLLLLHETLWAFPPAKQGAPLRAWHAIGTTLLLDTLLLAFLKVPREERNSRSTLLRVGFTACRLTSDFIPFAAVFFLWSASLVMIVAASLVPCLALLFHEAVRDIRRQRQRHGSIQM